MAPVVVEGEWIRGEEAVLVVARGVDVAGFELGAAVVEAEGGGEYV